MSPIIRKEIRRQAPLLVYRGLYWDGDCRCHEPKKGLTCTCIEMWHDVATCYASPVISDYFRLLHESHGGNVTEAQVESIASAEQSAL